MTRKEAIDTERMLEGLTETLTAHCIGDTGFTYKRQQCRADAESLRRISMTLHRWHELECGMDNGAASYCVVRGKRGARLAPGVHAEFEHDDNGAPYLEWHHHNGNRTDYRKIPDREKGALARLAKIMSAYPALSSYVQGDPRGASLYILRPGDVPAGERAESFYSRGVAVHQ